MESKGKSNMNTAFIVELFILFLILLVLIVTVTTVSAKARVQGLEAELLNGAVICAENMAEGTAPAEKPKQAAQLAKFMDGAQGIDQKDGQVQVYVLMKRGKKDTEYRLVMDMERDAGESGAYVKKSISVYAPEGTEPLYVLDTGSYIREGER